MQIKSGKSAKKLKVADDSFLPKSFSEKENSENCIGSKPDSCEYAGSKPDSCACKCLTLKLSDDKDLAKYAKYMVNPWHIMWRNFVAGTFHGVGFTLGTAVVLAIVGYSTTQLLDLTGLFASFTDTVNMWLENTLKSAIQT